MVVKDRVGRSRYVAFEITSEGSVGTGDLIATFKKAAYKYGDGEIIRPWLIMFEKGKGIVRCSHTSKDECINLLQAINGVGGKEVKIRTLGTSGTVRGARRKYLEGRE
ncbi:MAG: Rpp14/Pop5 family protein [Thermoplasmata archaeon]